MPSTHRLTGTRLLGQTIEFLDSMVMTAYPTTTTWEADILLEPDVTEYVYRHVDRDGSNRVWQTAVINGVYSTPREVPAANALDKWGDRLDTPRLTGEANVSYNNRLLDVFVHRGGPTHAGLLNAIARDLNLDYKDRGLIITANNSPVTGLRFSDVRVGLSNDYVTVSHTDLIITDEQAFVTPVNRSIVPAQRVSYDLRVKLADGTELDHEYDPAINTIYVDGEYGGESVLLSYNYLHRVSRRDKDLDTLKVDLEALANPAGDELISVEVAGGWGSKTAEKLASMPETYILEEHKDAANTAVAGLPLRWTDCIIESVWDADLHERVRTWTGSLWGTKIDKAFVSLAEVAKQTWGTAVADDSVYGSYAFALHGGQHMDMTYDAPLGFWENPVTGTRYDQWQAANGLDPDTGTTLIYKGIRKNEFQSGVGGKRDLRVSIRNTSAIIDTLAEGQTRVNEDSTEADLPDGTDPVEGYIETE